MTRYYVDPNMSNLRIFDASNGCAPGPKSKRSARSNI